MALETVLAWRRDLEAWAAALRARDVTFRVDLLPMGDDGLHPQEVMVLDPDGKVLANYAGGREYVVRILVQPRAPMGPVTHDDVAQLEERHEALAELMATWNARWGVPMPIMADASVVAGEDEAEEEDDALEGDAMHAPMQSDLDQGTVAEEVVPAAWEPLLVGELYVTLIEAGEAVMRMNSEGRLAIESVEGVTAIRAAEPPAPEASPDEARTEADAREDLGYVHPGHPGQAEGEQGQAMQALFQTQWAAFARAMGPRLAAWHAMLPGTVERRDASYLAFAGGAKIHPVLSRFPEVLGRLPAMAALLLPPTFLWVMSPGASAWSQASRSLPALEGQLWADFMSDDPTAVAPTVVYGHPLIRVAPLAFQLFREYLETDEPPPAWAADPAIWGPRA